MTSDQLSSTSAAMANKDKTDGKQPLSELEVLNWLKKNKDFLNKHPELYELLTPPKDTSQGKGIVDFQHYMVKRLKEDRDEVLESAREIVETSRANMSNQARIQRAGLLLMDAVDFEDFVRTITMDLQSVLGVDIVSLLVEAEDDSVPHINVSGVRAVTAGTIQLVTDGKTMVLEENIQGLQDVYGGGSGLVRSQALMTLNISGGVSPVLIAFGSRDPAMFQQGQGTEQLVFLGAIIERCFRRWLNLPR